MHTYQLYYVLLVQASCYTFLGPFKISSMQCKPCTEIKFSLHLSSKFYNKSLLWNLDGRLNLTIRRDSRTTWWAGPALRTPCPTCCSTSPPRRTPSPSLRNTAGPMSLRTPRREFPKPSHTRSTLPGIREPENRQSEENINILIVDESE